MHEDSIEELRERVRRLEDESAITRLIMSYGPAADAGLTSRAGQLWFEDGVYDWNAEGDPHQGSAGVDAMLQSDGHQGLIARGVAHFAGPILIKLDGDQAVAVNYSLVMRREEDRHYLWRVSAVRWDLERTGFMWRVRRRTNRLLDGSGAGRELFRDTLQALFEEEEGA
jgi:SnoaL-like protein